MKPELDVNIPRFNQLCVALLTGLAFVVQWWPLVALVATVIVVTIVGGPSAGLFTQIYVRFVQPRIDGPVETEPTAPHRFAQTLGATMLLVASALFIVGADAVGWILTLVVTALSTLAAATGICVGCLIYERSTT